MGDNDEKTYSGSFLHFPFIPNGVHFNKLQTSYLYLSLLKTEHLF